MKSKSPALPSKTRPAQRAGTPALTPWKLRLYVAGQTPRSLTALINLRRLCEAHLPVRHEIEVVDLMTKPELGQQDQIIALPTLIRQQPEPAKRLIGDLSNVERVLLSMGLYPARTSP